MKFRTKLLLFNIAIVASLTLLAILFVWDFRNLADLPSQEGSIFIKTQSNLTTLAKTSEVALATSDYKMLDQIMKRFQTDRDLVFLHVWNKNKKTVRSFGKGLSLEKLHKFPAKKAHRVNDRLVAAWIPVDIEAVSLGVVAAGYSMDRIHAVQNRTFLFITLVALAFFIAVAVSFFFSQKLTRPVLRMTYALRRMADGDLGQPKIAVESSDETGQMARAFNDMLTHLQSLVKIAREVAQGNLTISVTGKGDLANAFRDMVTMLSELSEKAREITQGNLGVVITTKGELADVFRDMRARLRGLFKQVTETVHQISSSAAQILAASRQQERGATEQSSAVEETQRTMETLLQSARQIAKASQGVLENAELTKSNNQLISERISQLSSHMQRIAEILEVIKVIANKSDLLALNASLEGTRAGEAGRGFSLVAAQMQRLAENVMDSVADIKSLTSDIRETTTATVLAIEEGGKLATSTTQSARQISLVTQQQQSGTEQVFQAMNEISEIARQTVDGSQQATTATEELTRLAERLQERLKSFSLASSDARSSSGRRRAGELTDEERA